MDAAKQAQLALLKQLHDEGMLNAEQYRAPFAFSLTCSLA